MESPRTPIVSPRTNEIPVYFGLLFINSNYEFCATDVYIRFEDAVISLLTHLFYNGDVDFIQSNQYSKEEQFQRICNDIMNDIRNCHSEKMKKEFFDTWINENYNSKSAGRANVVERKL